MLVTIMLILALLLGVAVADNVYSVHFNRQLTPTFVAGIETLLGYPCTETVPDNGLVLFLTTSSRAALELYYGPWLSSISVMSPESRVAPRLEQYGYMNDLINQELPRAWLEPRTVLAASHLEPTTLRLRVLIHPGALVSTAAETWQHAIHELASSVVVNNETAMTMDIMADTVVCLSNVPRADATTVALALSTSVVCVCYIEPDYVPQLTNLWSSSTTQQPGISSTSVTAADACTDCHSLWLAGLTGEGQLLAISDTGLSVDSCFFTDPTRAVPISSSISTIPPDTGHRSVRVMLTSNGDSVDANGHGTHVCGSAIGNPTGAADSPTALDAPDFTGVAPAARLVLVDIQIGSGGLSVPSPYDTQLLSYVYAAGARVHSGSWGVANFAYSDENRRVDSFCWTHRSFVAVFAAGNAGASTGASSILTPALAKNAIAAGAAMNGYSAFAIASGSVPTLPADAYAPDWLASFSSRGGASMPVPWMKPDIVAGGGNYIWSAANTGAASCTGSIGSLVVGLAGTSMSTPQVAAAAVIIRQFCMDGYYRDTSFEPMGSLVRALIVASATPMRGVFPQTALGVFNGSNTYAPYGGGYLVGHGHIGIARVLVQTDKLVLLSNEEREMTTAGQVHRYCIQTVGDIVVTLSYTDYPGATLINDLDLRVYVDGSSTPAPVNGLTGRDNRSPTEVVRIHSSTGRVRIEVHSFAIGFSTQSYSLVLLASSTPTLIDGQVVPGVISNVPVSLTAGSCLTCTDGTYRATCPTCGNGIVDSGEECESGACCNLANCQLYRDGRVCLRQFMSPTCHVYGTCVANASASTECFISPIGMMYTVNASGACVPTVAPSPSPAPTSSPAITPLCVDAALRQVVPPNGSICCVSYADIAQRYVSGEGGPLDPIFAQLSRHIVTTLINFQRGVVASTLLMMRVSEATSLLESSCIDGFRSSSVRRTAFQLVEYFRTVNSCSGTSEAPSTSCVVEQSRANVQYCQGKGTYDALNDVCVCSASQHQDSSSCEARHCSGHGMSVTGNTCTCWPGWSGSTCSSCAPAATGLTHVCVGLDRQRVPSSLAGNVRVLVPVASATVSTRLSGTAYAPAQDKVADVLPGTNGVDCWCLAADHRIDYTTFPTHAAAVAASATYWSQRDTLLAVASPRLLEDNTATSAPVPPPPPPVSSGASRIRSFF